jgi:hypothetical protein
MECLIAMTISTIVAISVFQLFGQNERIFRDQAIVLEMQQTARLAAFQIADEIRLAGQGVPLYSAAFDATPGEDAAIILPGSNASRIHFRAGISNVESEATAAPLQLIAGFPSNIPVADSTLFTGLANRHVFLSGPIGNGVWGWTRAILGAPMQVTPVRSILFIGHARISLDEAIAIYRDPATNSIRRTAAVDMTSSSNPVWGPANELAANVSRLRFTYHDGNEVEITPDSLDNRNRIKRITIDLTVRSAAPVGGGQQPDVSLSLRSKPRNLSIR